ncbi:dTDP-4-dehydrorhamnose reductase family protein [Methylobacterium nodulans]|uniref:dTDP-4-dehydrorhamnose reductase n=1 Tax=Methylobacterium nodulans (strain LMG 21967 / CNCM I-2342 / ORS 2060) TaxID=460265 RepID=B8IAC4_METNO|nr:SDR family oxidoreductase [Methylobacterium nodulans]ACL59187.1 dTDP-4-dehydrorhamnose reductase [Methylobacterium nodulans ORS 2060]
MRILVLGARGMLGRACLSILAPSPGFEVHGSVRGAAPHDVPPGAGIIAGIDVLNTDHLAGAIRRVRPQVVINAVGVIKQLSAAHDPLEAVPINTLLPHRLADLCELAGARLVTVSTDCVFDGKKGQYTEADRVTATDLYGLSKHLGEITGRQHVLTLRTSIIGREHSSANGLLEWFLRSGPVVSGYRHAVFSGFPTVVLAEIIRDYVLPRPDLHGLYHVSSDAISKFDLLKLIAGVYEIRKTIEPVAEPQIDRSLNSDRFRSETGFAPAAWKDMLVHMRALQG